MSRTVDRLLLLDPDMPGPMSAAEYSEESGAASASDDAWAAVGEPLADHGADPNDLRRRGWAAVLASDRADELREALAPLLDARRTEAAIDIVTLPPRLPRAELLASLRESTLTMDRASGERPGFVLVAGEPEDLGFAIEDHLRPHARVGRVPTRDVVALHEYAVRVARSIDWPSPPEPVVTLGNAIDPADEIHLDGGDFLKSVATRLARRAPSVRVSSTDFGSRETWYRAAQASQMSVLVAHGRASTSWTPPEFRARCQGDLVFSDISSPSRHQSCPDGVVALWSCLSAGTRSVDDVRATGPRTRPVGTSGLTLDIDHPTGFISAEASRLLLAPNGPVAVLGFANWAFLPSPTPEARYEQGYVELLAEFLVGLSRGHRVGVAAGGFTRQMYQQYLAFFQSLSTGAAVEHVRSLRRALQTSASVLVLGDPAARLSASPRQAEHA